MTIKHALFFVPMLLVPLFSASAEICWATRDMDVVADKSSGEYKTQFTFLNKNTKAVKIKSAHSSCGCTVSKVIYNEVAPGTEGVIEVAFTFGHRQGRNSKQIIVETDDEDTPISHLTLTVDIPAVFHAIPEQVSWRGNSPAIPILINVSTDSEAGLKFQGIRVSDPMFRGEITRLNRDGNVELMISSVDLSSPKSASLIIDYLDKKGIKRSFVVPLIISDSEGKASSDSKTKSDK